MPPRKSPRKQKAAIVESSVAKTTVSKTSGMAKVESKTRTAKRKVIEPTPEPEITSEEEPEINTVKKRKTVANAKAKVQEEYLVAEEPKAAAPKKQRATKAKAKPEDAMPLAERTVVASLRKAMRIGAHVSSAGGNA